LVICHFEIYQFPRRVLGVSFSKFRCIPDSLPGVHFRIAMKITLKRSIWLLLFLSIAAICISAFRSKDKGEADRMSRVPQTVVWAWERPEDLKFIDPAKIGVAYLAKTISLSGESVLTRPRLQALEIPAGTKVIAVVRIESDRTDTPVLTDVQLNQVTTEITKLKDSHFSSIQIDFDASKSERTFYRKLIFEVSKQISPLPLSITALASWCSGDKWLQDLPIAEAVPMFFRMGVERGAFASRLAEGNIEFAAPCDRAAGVSTDELISEPKVDRLYIFSPTPWTPVSLNKAMEDFKR
jgi:hypothetical protein